MILAQMRKIKRILLYILFLLAFTFIALEIILRIHNPFPVRLKGDKIILPVNQHFVITNNTGVSKIDKKIIQTRNSMGFRGDEKPVDFENYLSLVAIGGSTTECFYTSDHHDWPNVLGDDLRKSFRNIWINNAGLDGHSTFGHQIMVNDFMLKLKPKVVLFLTGINDIGVENLSASDQHNLVGHGNSVVKFLAEHSEVINILRVLYKVHSAIKLNITYQFKDLVKYDKLLIPDDVIEKKLEEQQPHAKNYKMRILKLISTCRENNIEPVWLTQPTLTGVGIDSLTGVNLETIKVNDSTNGKEYWRIMQLYNDQIREAGQETGMLVVDLAEKLPKESSLFFDLTHYTNTGCAKVAGIIADELSPRLEKDFPQYVLKNKQTAN
jgi:lysophospholipase L1-like esterase